ncbi:hypothetical protein IFM89_004131 [Coptis chinensis]|uniref:Uncharacterized protein n=1 Tax=Coptis chinensis TaxID=261450 RepID=A0A835H6E1_9MAGN|nr:hypothetical protein IFM89_004131 [Coptis chinensis]
MDFVPEESAIKVETIEVDKETMDMHAALGMGDLEGVSRQAEPERNAPFVGGYGGGREKKKDAGDWAFTKEEDAVGLTKWNEFPPMRAKYLCKSSSLVRRDL